MHEIDTVAEVYLEPVQTYMAEMFCGKSQQFFGSNKISIIENLHGFLNTSLSYRDFRVEYLIL